MFYFTWRLGGYQGGVLERFFVLREEWLSFTMTTVHKEIIHKQKALAFCVIRRNIQETECQHAGEISDRISGFRGTTFFLLESLSKANDAPFPRLCMFLTENSISKCPTLVMTAHLQCLEEHFGTYFPIRLTVMSVSEIEQLIELLCDRMLHTTHSRVTTKEPWFMTQNTLPSPSGH